MTSTLDREHTAQGGVWVSIAELGRIKSISRQAAKKRVDRLEASGKIQTRVNGEKREVELASFDRAVGQHGDIAREMAAETKKQDAPLAAGGAYRDAQTDRARYDAQLRALDLAERTGQLVPVRGEHGVETALMRVTESIVRDLGAPMNWVSDILEAAREGEPALRRLLRKKIRELRETMAGRLAVIAGEAIEAEKSGIQVDIEFEGGE